MWLLLISKNGKNGSHTIEDPLQRHMLTPEKKKTRNIGSKNKRLLMRSDEAMELRVTWEEAQELLRPPPTNSPTIIKIEDYEFEEYDVSTYLFICSFIFWQMMQYPLINFYFSKRCQHASSFSLPLSIKAFKLSISSMYLYYFQCLLIGQEPPIFGKRTIFTVQPSG